MRVQRLIGCMENSWVLISLAGKLPFSLSLQYMCLILDRLTPPGIRRYMLGQACLAECLEFVPSKPTVVHLIPRPGKAAAGAFILIFLFRTFL